MRPYKKFKPKTIFQQTGTLSFKKKTNRNIKFFKKKGILKKKKIK